MKNLYLEDGLDSVPDLQVLSPLAVIMEGLALDGFCEFLFLLLGQLFWIL